MASAENMEVDEPSPRKPYARNLGGVAADVAWEALQHAPEATLAVTSVNKLWTETTTRDDLIARRKYLFQDYCQRFTRQTGEVLTDGMEYDMWRKLIDKETGKLDKEKWDFIRLPFPRIRSLFIGSVEPSSSIERGVVDGSNFMAKPVYSLIPEMKLPEDVDKILLKHRFRLDWSYARYFRARVVCETPLPPRQVDISHVALYCVYARMAGGWFFEPLPFSPTTTGLLGIIVQPAVIHTLPEQHTFTTSTADMRDLLRKEIPCEALKQFPLQGYPDHVGVYNMILWDKKRQKVWCWRYHRNQPNPEIFGPFNANATL